MRAMIRLMAIAAAALALGGCNIVISETPVFTAADAAGAPGFRPGLWVKVDGDCAFDPATKASTWPKCADPMVLEADRMVDPSKPGQVIPFILAAGKPRVMQIHVETPDKGKDAIGKAISSQIEGYFFIGVEPVRTDDAGRITEAVTWLSLCGPPPPEPKEPKGPADYATRRPIKGLTVDKETGNCAPVDAAAVRRAADLTRGLKKPPAADKDAKSNATTFEPQSIRWVRDGKD